METTIPNTTDQARPGPSPRMLANPSHLNGVQIIDHEVRDGNRTFILVKWRKGSLVVLERSRPQRPWVAVARVSLSFYPLVQRTLLTHFWSFILSSLWHLRTWTVVRKEFFSPRPHELVCGWALSNQEHSSLNNFSAAWVMSALRVCLHASPQAPGASTGTQAFEIISSNQVHT